MSNRANLILTKFTDYDESVSYGYRIFDDYEAFYDNFMTEEDYKKYRHDPIGLWEYVENNATESMINVIDYAKTFGVSINDIWYDAEDIS